MSVLSQAVPRRSPDRGLSGEARRQGAGEGAGRAGLPQLRHQGRVHRAADVQRAAADLPGRGGAGRGGGRGFRAGVPAPGDGPGHLHQLQERPADVTEEDPVRHRPDRQVVPQRDHAGKLHLPHPRVRADGDGILRQAGHRRGVARAWIQARLAWYRDLGLNPENLRLYEHPADKRSHYSKRTVDIEYRYGFQGSEWGELEGIANRTDVSLSTPAKASGQDMSYLDPETSERYVPYVVEPAAGVDRSRLAFLLVLYAEDDRSDAKGGM